MKYIGKFLNIEDQEYRVEFITPSVGPDKEITLCAEPVIVEYQGDSDIFKPLKLSGATIKCWVKDYMFDLYSGEAKGVKCILYKGDNIEWCGYVTPNLYSQDYMQEKFEVSIECVDALSILEYFRIEVAEKKIRSFKDVIDKAIEITGYQFNMVTCDFSNYKLEDLYISDQNWFSEDDESMTYKEILENIMSFLNLTMYQWKNNIYIVDYNLIKKKTNFVNIQDHVVYNTPTISLTEVYNNININSSLYNSSYYIPELTNKNNLRFKNASTPEQSGDSKIVIGDYTYIRRTFYNPLYEFPVYDANKNEVSGVDIDLDNIGSYFATLPMRAFNYKTKDGVSSANWEYYALIHKKLGNLTPDIPFIKTKTNKPALYPRGYFNISFETMFPYRSRQQPDADPPTGKGNINVVSASFVKATLKVGEYYYVGLTYWANQGRWIHESDPILAIDKTCVIYIGETGSSRFDIWHSARNEGRYEYGVENFNSCIIPTPEDFILHGEIEFSLNAPYMVYGGQAGDYVFLKDLKLEFDVSYFDDVSSTPENRDTDTVYSVNINELNISDFGDLECKIATQNEKGLSYASVAVKQADGKFNFLKFITKKNNNEIGICEQHLLNSYYEQNKEPRKSIDIAVKHLINPDDLILDSNYPDHKFIVNSMSINYESKTTNLNIVEKA